MLGKLEWSDVEESVDIQSTVSGGLKSIGMGLGLGGAPLSGLAQVPGKYEQQCVMCFNLGAQ